MAVFPTSAHLVSWSKVAPRAIQSGAKTRSGTTGKGNPYLKSALGEAAAAAARTNTFLGARYRRLARPERPSTVEVQNLKATAVHADSRRSVEHAEGEVGDHCAVGAIPDDTIYPIGRLRLAMRSQRTMRAVASSQNRHTTAQHSAWSSKCSLLGMTACQ